MQNAETSFDSAARRISQAPAPQPQDTASLSDNAVALAQSGNGFEANAKLAHAADQLTRTTLNMLA
jgi:Flp pilus assembly protein TadD